MADNVIICGTRRNKEDIPINDILQMCGRTARKKGSTGYVNIFVDGDINEFANKLKDEKNKQIESKINFIDNLCFHIVADINAESISTSEQLIKWYSKSFAFFQGIDLEKNINKALKKLEENGIIDYDGIFISNTYVGTIASKLYFHPLDIKKWEENLTTVFELGKLDKDEYIAWFLGNIHYSKSSPFDFRNIDELVENLCCELRSEGLEYEGTLHNCILWLSMLGWPSCSSMKMFLENMKQDYSRVISAIRMIIENNFEMKNNLFPFINELESRLKNKIGRELVELFDITGMTKNSALELYHNFNIKNEKELLDNIESVKTFGSENLVNNVNKWINNE